MDEPPRHENSKPETSRKNGLSPFASQNAVENITTLAWRGCVGDRRGRVLGMAEGDTPTLGLPGLQRAAAIITAL